MKWRRGHLEKQGKRLMVLCNWKRETLQREGRAAAHQVGHCQQLPHQHHHFCLEQAVPSPVGQVLGAACTPLMGLQHGETYTRVYRCDLTGSFSPAVGGSQGAGWGQVEPQQHIRCRRVCRKGDTALLNERVRVCNAHDLCLWRGSAHNCVQHLTFRGLVMKECLEICRHLLTFHDVWSCGLPVVLLILILDV